jgi:hypothetical protein
MIWLFFLAAACAAPYSPLWQRAWLKKCFWWAVAIARFITIKAHIIMMP